MAPDVPERLVRTLAHIAPGTLKEVPNLSSSRIPSLPGAALLLREVAKTLSSKVLISSAHGVREGLLFDALPPNEQRRDPFLAAAEEEGTRQGRFPEQGPALMRWMAGLFDDPPAMERIRCAACLLSDVAWRAHPDFRAERGVEIALHGNWTAVTARERTLLAAALNACFGGPSSGPIVDYLRQLADAESLARARTWGLALRLGQRLTGGTADALLAGGLSRGSGTLILRLDRRHAALYGDTVARRLKTLAQALALEPKVQIAG
jgi:exopolyphosphatase/guanosine-5'-triphosphate,3'-diphosphate pyrophosphatase